LGCTSVILATWRNHSLRPTLGKTQDTIRKVTKANKERKKRIEEKEVLKNIS
jgi:hypothetical protein